MLNKMLIKPLPLVCCLLLSGVVTAQDRTAQDTECRTDAAQRQQKVLGKTIDVQGLVTVSNGTQVAGVANENPVINTTRYVTSSTGFVTLKFDRCEVKLKPNQAVTVDECKICDGMIAAIETMPGAGGSGPGVGLALIGAALLAGSTGGSIVLGGTPPDNGGGGGLPTPPSNQ